MNLKKCNAKCPHLRSIRYGFDASQILAPYNGRDQIAACVKYPGHKLHMRALPVCAVNSIMTELRCNGYDVITRCVGRGRYEYQLQNEGL